MFVVMKVLQGLLFRITSITASYSCNSHKKNTWFLYWRRLHVQHLWHIRREQHQFVPVSAAHTIPWTERLPKTAPLWLCPPVRDKFGFAGLQNQHCDGDDHHCNQQQTQDAYNYFFCSHQFQAGECQKCQFDSHDTHLLSLPSLVVGWVCAAWQCHAWRAALGSWAGRRRTGSRTLCLPRSPLPLYSTLARRCPQTHTSLFQKTHGRTWEKERNGEIRRGKTSRSGTFCASMAHEHLVELKFVCFTSISRRLNAPKSQPGLLLNKWSFWYTGKWLNWRSWGYKLKLENW